jgi:hypothetical protein
MVTPQVTVLNPLHLEENKDVDIVPASFDPTRGENGTVRYRLTDAGMVRVYIRPRNRRFLAIVTLADWQPQEAGEQELKWDGRDTRGNILNPALYCAAVQSQPLRGSVAREHLPLDKELHHEDMVAHGHERSHAHTLHEADNCHQLKVSIESPPPMEKITGSCKIVTRVSEEARGYGREVGHSARYYIDYLLLHEDKDVDGPVATWEWDTRGLPNGSHVLSVACCDHHDHMASDSIVVEIANS